MRKSVVTCIVFLGLSWSANACRLDIPQEQRLPASDIAVIGRISGVYIPSLEQADAPTYAPHVSVASVLADKEVRISVVEVLKGKAPTVLSVKVGDCQGGAVAVPGNMVHAYQLGGSWFLYDVPDQPEPKDGL